jgi:hypothetical protein
MRMEGRGILGVVAEWKKISREYGGRQAGIHGTKKKKERGGNDNSKKLTMYCFCILIPKFAMC